MRTEFNAILTTCNSSAGLPPTPKSWAESHVSGGMRVTVGMIVEALAAGRSVQDLLSEFPYLEDQDIREALAYAANLAQGREFPLAS